MVMVSEMKEKKSAKKKEHVSLAKKLMYDEIAREFGAGKNFFFSRFDRLSVSDMSDLRRSLEKVSKRTLVVKHALAKKFFESSSLADAVRFLKGSILVTVGGEEPQLTSKTLVNFAKGKEHMELRGLVLDGKIYDGNFIKELAKLPSRKDLLGILASRMQSPIARFAMTLNGVLQSFVSVLNEIQKKKAQAEAQA